MGQAASQSGQSQPNTGAGTTFTPAGTAEQRSTPVDAALASGQVSAPKPPQREGAAVPADLAAVVEAWPALPGAVKAGIVALVRAAKGQ